jgi:hypothetical protein
MRIDDNDRRAKSLFYLVWMTYESHPATGLRSVRYALKQEKQVSIKHMFQENEFAPCKVRSQNILCIYIHTYNTKQAMYYKKILRGIRATIIAVDKQ